MAQENRKKGRKYKIARKRIKWQYDIKLKETIKTLWAIRPPRTMDCSQAKDGEVFESRGGKDLRSLFITNFSVIQLIQVIMEFLM